MKKLYGNKHIKKGVQKKKDKLNQYPSRVKIISKNRRRKAIKGVETKSDDYSKRFRYQTVPEDQL